MTLPPFLDNTFSLLLASYLVALLVSIKRRDYQPLLKLLFSSPSRIASYSHRLEAGKYLIGAQRLQIGIYTYPRQSKNLFIRP